MQVNKAFPSCLLTLCQNESECETIHIKMCTPTGAEAHFHVNQTHFQIKSFAQALVLYKVIRK